MTDNKVFSFFFFKPQAIMETFTLTEMETRRTLEEDMI